MVFVKRSLILKFDFMFWLLKRVMVLKKSLIFKVVALMDSFEVGKVVRIYLAADIMLVSHLG